MPPIPDPASDRLPAAAGAGPAPTRKLARRAADRIISEVVARGWPVGEVLGSEVELLERYGLSRAVFREAVRIVEHLQVARMRRGPGGGLVVAEPMLDAVSGAVLVLLHRVQPDFDEIVEASVAVEELAVELASARVTEADIGELRDLTRREAAEPTCDRELHSMLASMTRNPPLELFIDLLNEVARLYVPDIRSVTTANRRDASRAHGAIVSAVVAGDGAQARERMRGHLDHESEWVRRRRPHRQWPVPVSTPPAGAKMAEVLASEMIAEIVAEGWPVGAFLGSETDLMERHKVSRAVFREAIRLLEHHQVVAMRRGPGGGLFVTEPTAAAITDAAAVYLERRGLDVEHLSEIRLGLELALLDLVIEHLDDAGMARLRDSLEVDRATSDAVFSEVVHDVHAVIASLARNSLLELFAGVLVRLTWLRQPPSPWAVGQMQNRSVTEVQHSHAGIVEAIIARDRELARHRLRRHLVALGGFK